MANYKNVTTGLVAQWNSSTWTSGTTWTDDINGKAITFSSAPSSNGDDGIELTTSITFTSESIGQNVTGCTFEWLGRIDGTWASTPGNVVNIGPANGTWGSNNINFYSSSSNGLQVDMNGSGSITSSISTSGIEYHIVLTITSAGAATLYVNSTTSVGTKTVSACGSAIKNYVSNTEGSTRFKGAVKRMSLWNSVLSSSDIATLFEENLTTYDISTSFTGDGTISPEGTTTVTEGDSFTLTVTPDSGEATVVDNGVDVTSTLTSGTGNSKKYTISSVTEDHTISVAFGVTHTITTAITNGTFTSHSGSSLVVLEGNDATVTFVPNTHYIVSTIAVNGSFVTATNNSGVYSYTISDIDNDYIISVTCTELPKYTVTTSITNGTLVSPTATRASIYKGEDYVIYFTYFEDSVFSSITVGGVEVTPTLSDDVYSYTISNITADTAVVIVYTIPPRAYVNTSLINGKFITPSSGSMHTTIGGDITLTFAGDDGEDFNKMIIDGVEVTPTLHQPSATITYTASTNYTQYSNYAIANCVDGSESTLFWSSTGQAEGKYVMLTFSEPVILTGVKTTSNKNDNSSTIHSDQLNPGNMLQVSEDGTNWTDVARWQTTEDGTYEFTDLCYPNIKYVRSYYISGTQNNWLVINEFTPSFIDTYYTYEFTDLQEDKNVTIIFGDDVTTNTVTTTITNGTLTEETIPSKIIVSGTDTTLNFKATGDNIFKSMMVNGEEVTPTLGHKGTTNYTVSSNYTQASGTNMIYYATDGVASTYYETSDGQTAGKYIMLTFDEAVTISGCTTTCSTSGKYLQANNVLQVSTDGTTWTNVGTFAAQETNTFTNINKPGIMYLRIYATSDNSTTLNINEFTPTFYTVVDEYEYVLSNVTEDQTVVITFGPYTGGYVKYEDGKWHKTAAIYQKTDSGWNEIDIEDFKALLNVYKLIYKS